MYNVPYDRERAALIRIANAITGSNDESDANGNRIAYALERLASYFESHTMQTSSELPAVTAANNGNVLTVVNGAWAAAAVPTELPAVTAEDNGSVLTVAEGAWAAVPPESTQEPQTT